MAYPDNTEITCQQTYESNNRCDSTIDIRADAVVLLYQRVGGGPAVRRFGGSGRSLYVWFYRACQPLKQLLTFVFLISFFTSSPSISPNIIPFLPFLPTARNNHLTKCQVPLDCARKAIHLLSLVLYRLQRDAL